MTQVHMLEQMWIEVHMLGEIIDTQVHMLGSMCIETQVHM